MPEISLLTWAVGIAALVIGILAGHFGWGKRWPGPLSRLHPDYLTGLDYLVTEQPDRALDMFLKLMDANADTIETHFSLGALYRRRGEVERAIRIHQTLPFATGSPRTPTISSWIAPRRRFPRPSWWCWNRRKPRRSTSTTTPSRFSMCSAAPARCTSGPTRLSGFGSRWGTWCASLRTPSTASGAAARKNWSI